MTHILLIIFVILIAAIGAAVGSFLNVVIWRVPEKMNLSTPPSHCPKCNSPIRWFDNVPILSWFVLKGKCRDCSEPISFRYPLVEFLSFLVALIVGWALLLGGWTGMKSQPLYWEDYVNWVNAYEKVVDVNEVIQDETAAGSGLLNDQLDALLSSDVFLDLLRSTTILAIFWTLIVDLALMLGFVEWDREVAPRSLICTTFITLIIALLVNFWINEQPGASESALKFVMSAFLGGIGGCLCGCVLKKYRLDLITLGTLWGVVSGYILAFPGVITIVLVSTLVSCWLKKQVWGIVTFGAILLLLFAETVLGFNIA